MLAVGSSSRRHAPGATKERAPGKGKRAGRAGSRVALALETHYPGNVRAVHAGLLETYNLKSLDGVTSAPLERLTFARAPGGGVAVGVAGGAGCARDAHGRAAGRCSFRAPDDVVVACLGWRFDAAPFAAGAVKRGFDMVMLTSDLNCMVAGARKQLDDLKAATA